jgi:DNA-binding winged helix-turn-helix (wHTH) protein/TolB-like protein/Tfp pilus assembly protein PilF
MAYAFQFGEFRLDPRERLLQRGPATVSIAPKAFDCLLVLVENAGNLVDRAALRDRLWSGAIVEEATLARLIADIRKALDDLREDRRYIETIPKHGYRFVATVERIPLNGITEAPEPALDKPALDEPLDEPLRIASVATLHHSVWRKWVLAGIVGAVVIAGATIWARNHSRPRAQSLLIAPFQIIGEMPNKEALQFGVQDSMTTELSALSELSVRPAKYNPQASVPVQDAAQLGRDYQADLVLTGSLQVVGNRMHVNARIVRSATGQALWTSSFEEPVGDLLQIESAMAKRAASELVPVLSTKDGERLARRFPANSEAHRYYLLGRHYWNQRDVNSYLEAIRNFEKAAAADPSFALAYTGLADTYLLLGSARSSPLETLPRATLALEKAVKLDPELGEAHATLGLIAESYEFNWDKAEQEFRTAIRLAPNYATAHHWYAELLSMLGKFGMAHAEFELARELDPVSPIILTDLAQLYNFEKDYSRSLQTLDDVLKLDPAFHLAHDRKGIAFLLMRRPKEALEEFRIADRETGRQQWVGLDAWAAVAAGKRKEALELVRRAEIERPNAFVLAVIWAQLGDNDRAMQWLEPVYEARGGGFASLKVNPIFDPLRSDPRFQALLHKMNLI